MEGYCAVLEAMNGKSNAQIDYSSVIVCKLAAMFATVTLPIREWMNE